MRVSKDFILREIAGEFMLVPVGKAATNFNGLITMNEIGDFLFRALEQEQSEKELVEKILQEYDVDRDTAQKDLQEFLQQLRELGALIEN